MKVSELIYALIEFDEDREVVIAQRPMKDGVLQDLMACPKLDRVVSQLHEIVLIPENLN